MIQKFGGVPCTPVEVQLAQQIKLNADLLETIRGLRIENHLLRDAQLSVKGTLKDEELSSSDEGQARKAPSPSG